MSPASGWQLGIDFGTSYTVAAISGPGGTAVLDVENNGQSRMPSSVFVGEDGQILVGTAAQHQALFAPDRFEATPKRWIADGELFLGNELIPVTELIAGVLRRVFAVACRQRNETMPDVVRLTHPAEWGTSRLNLLREAAQRAGLPPVELVPEPVAAAVWIAGAVTEVGDRIAVFDFGGGTFDAAVLRRTATAFEVAGPPAGRDPLGGEDIDQHIIDYIGTVFSADAPEDWKNLIDPPDVAWRRRSSALRMEVQRAKETLSEVTSCQLWIPGLEREMQLSRDELDKLITDDVDTCTDVLFTALADASVEPSDLRGVYLVGGSSRIPLVATKLWERLKKEPSVQDSPKSVVALGAARWMDGIEEPQEEGPDEGTTITINDALPPLAIHRATSDGRTMVAPVLLFGSNQHMDALRRRSTVQLRMDRTTGGPPATIRLREEAATTSGVQELATKIGAFRQVRVHGYHDLGAGPATVLGLSGGERRFLMSRDGGAVHMVEQYLQAGDRAIVIAFPEEVRDVAAQLTMAGPWPAPLQMVVSPVWMPRPVGWTTAEQIHALAADGSRLLLAERAELPDEPVEAWRWHRLESVLRDLPQAATAGRVGGRILGGRPAEIVTIRWPGRSSPMLAKFGTAAEDGQGFVIALTLPLPQQADFPRLAGMVGLSPVFTSA